jgi:serine/threonine-protein kinase
MPPASPLNRPAQFFGQWAEVAHAIEEAVRHGAWFVPTDEAREPGTTLEFQVQLGTGAGVTVAGTVLRSDFDDAGNTGLQVQLDARALGALRLLEGRAVPPMATPTGSVVVDGGLVQALEPGTVVEGRFSIEAHLASGGMGDVYRATHVHLKRPVALKLLKQAFAADAEMSANFRREAELASQLESPHVVRVFDFGQTSWGQPWIAMEYVEGRTLEALLGEGPVSPARAAGIVAQICEALAEAHALGIVHRDLKPANLILGRRRDGSEIVKVLDFGIARPTSEVEGAGGRPRLAMGTPSYLPPEQARAAPCDARTDLYALGCVLFELLTGRPPFQGRDMAQVVLAHVKTPPPHLSDVSPDFEGASALDAVLQRALQKVPADRFASAADFAHALSDAVAQPLASPPSGVAAPLWVPPGLWAGRHALAAGAPVVLLSLEASGAPPLRDEALSLALREAERWGVSLEALTPGGACLGLAVRPPEVPPTGALLALALLERVEAALTGQVSFRVGLVPGARGAELVERAAALLQPRGFGAVFIDPQLGRLWAEAITVDAQGRVGARRAPTRLPLPPVAPSVGRELGGRLHRLKQGAGGAVLVTTHPGDGREALTAEFTAHARTEGLFVAHARVTPGGPPERFQLFSELVCAICGVVPERRLGALPRTLEGLRAQLPAGELAAVRALGGVIEAPPTFTPGQAVNALRALLQARSMGRPSLLVLEGLEAADPLSVAVFRALAERPLPRTLLVGLVDLPHPLQPLGAVALVATPPMEERELAEWLTTTLGAPAHDSLTHFLLRRSRGLPQRARDWLAVVDRRGLLRQQGSAVALMAEPPALDATELMAERFRLLSLGARRLVELVALWGEPCSLAQLGAALPSEGQAIEEALSSGCLLPLPGERYVLAPEAPARELVAGGPGARQVAHAHVLEALRAQERALPGSVDPVLAARHQALAGDPQGALAALQQAAHAAMTGGVRTRLGQALRGLADALGVLGEQALKPRVDALARATGVACSRQDPALARALLDEALELARARDLRSSELAYAEARVLRSEARPQKALAALARAEQLGQGGPLKPLLDLERSELHEEAGQLEAALGATEQALAMASSARELSLWYGEVDLLARIESRLASLSLAIGNFTAARRLSESAWGRWRKVGWAQGEARVLFNLGAACLKAGQPQEACRFCEAAAEAAERAGDLLLQARALRRASQAIARAEAQRSRQLGQQAHRLAAAIGWKE